MKKLVAVILSFAVISAVAQAPTSNNTELNTTLDASQTQELINKVKPECDGTYVVSDCTLGGIEYKKYIYHPAVAEKYHNEQVVTYEEKLTGYCTLCVDGTYSPSCATGRGACSWHGGVSQWNAPVYKKVPQYSTKKVIDSPAKKAYYEKVKN